MDRQALPHVSHATSQPHSSMLSLPYPYAMPMVYPYAYALPMVVPQPCTATTHTPLTQSHERATERPQRATGTGRHHHWHTPPQRPPESRSQRQAPRKGSPFFNFCEGRPPRPLPQKFSLRLKGVEILFFLDFYKGVPLEVSGAW